MARTYDRRAQDVGNILALEHVNVRVPDQVLATVYYVQGLGPPPAPYLMVDPENMWVSVGQEQFHLPTGGPYLLRGCVGLVVPDLDALTARLAGARGGGRRGAGGGRARGGEGGGAGRGVPRSRA